MNISELPEYIQSSLAHLIVEDEKKNSELESESYYAFSPEMIRWVNENREAYSECKAVERWNLLHPKYRIIIP